MYKNDKFKHNQMIERLYKIFNAEQVIYSKFFEKFKVYKTGEYSLIHPSILEA